MTERNSSEETLQAIYNPTTGMIACVLIQAAYGASQGVANMFPCEDWETGISAKMTRFAATRAEWRKIAAMSREERIERWASFQSAPTGN